MRSWAARITSPVGAIVVLVAALALTVLTFVTSPEQPDAEPTDGLPADAQSTTVTDLQDRFPSGRAAAVLVVVERADGPLTGADNDAVAAIGKALGGLADVTPPVPAPDGRAVLVTAVLDADGGGAINSDAQNDAVDALRAAVRGVDLPDGLTAYVTGGPAFGRDIAAAFQGADVNLLLATVVVVALLLIVTYRSPVLFIVPLLVIGAGDQAVAKLLPWIARLLGERTDASVSGIVSVLVFGAGTNYALLLISRYREELRRVEDRREAMVRALTGVAPAVLAAAGTVILALLTLLLAVLTSNRTLGISAAIGVAIALLFGLVVLPAALVCVPRGIFWPFVPKPDVSDREHRGLWAAVGRGVARRPVAVLVLAVVALGALAAGLTRADIGLAQTEQFRTQVESVDGQEALGRHFPAGASQPVAVVADASASDSVTAVVKRVDGVSATGRTERSTDGTLVKISVELSAATGTPAADKAVRDLRAALDGAGVDGALVGGAPASDLDKREATLRDTRLIAPLILAVVLLVLLALLRAALAPVLILLTVVATYVASLGAATLLLTTVFDFPALDATAPLLSFLFLVALGVDYNIFLVTRAREEARESGDTRAGMVRGLAATGAVITSAGVLLAAVFAVLGVLPVIVLTQIGVIVGIGVLLDTLLVRTVVVPAIALVLGDRFWWPQRFAPAAAPDEPAASLRDSSPERSGR